MPNFDERSGAKFEPKPDAATSQQPLPAKFLTMIRTAMSDSIQAHIRDVPDFPKPGIVFKDITPLLENATGFRAAIEALAERLRMHAPTVLVAIESRGFIFGAALALYMGLPLVLVRKPGKLPRRTESVSYLLEYGEDSLEVHADAVDTEGRYAIVDDVLATGGTAAAVASLLKRLDGTLVCCAFLIELAFLSGRAKLGDTPVERLIEY